MDKIKITYVTGNQLKVDLLKRNLDENEFEVVINKFDCPEIQHDEIVEVAKYSAKYASELLKTNVLKNDSGLVIPALKGFPSAYSKYVEQTLGSKGIIALMEGITDRRAYYLDAFCYQEYGKDPVVFVSKTYGFIAEKASGDYGSGFDKVFIPAGKNVTMANMTTDEFLSCFDNTGINELVNYLKNNKYK